MTLAANMLHVAAALTDSLLFRCFALIAVADALIYVAMCALYRLDRHLAKKDAA